MFRCQYSGEVSDPASYKTVVCEDETVDGRSNKILRKTLAVPAEKPVRVVIEKRYRMYENWGENEDGYPVRVGDTQGTEIVRELLVRAKYVDIVKKKYGVE